MQRTSFIISIILSISTLSLLVVLQNTSSKIELKNNGEKIIAVKKSNNSITIHLPEDRVIEVFQYSNSDRVNIRIIEDGNQEYQYWDGELWGMITLNSSIEKTITFTRFIRRKDGAITVYRYGDDGNIELEETLERHP